MGTAITAKSYSPADYRAFSEKLQLCLRALRGMLSQPSFGEGETTIGAELELYLIDANTRPACASDEILRVLDDPLFTHEINRFNLEFNAPYGPLAGRPFETLGRQVDAGLSALRSVAAPLAVRALPIGILPTLELEDLHPSVLTDQPRYRVLDDALRERRGSDFHIHINGADPLELDMSHVTAEGAATSWQLHLRVPPAAFGSFYNAAQLILAPVLAVSGNSPFFVGQRLWHETRIALFKQAVDSRRGHRDEGQPFARVAFGSDWISGGIDEVFEREILDYEPLIPECHAEDPIAELETGRVPQLHELRLHNSTVWLWNRPVYDPAGGGHIRIELRALPAGPTVRDMLANSALSLGLIFAMQSRAPHTLLPFALAQANFYRAAEQGLDAVLWWPNAEGDLAQSSARQVLQSILPLAYEGLREAGVADAECSYHLEPIEGRLRSGQTGATWQLESFRRLQGRLSREEALADLVTRYHDLSLSDQPVYTWPAVPDSIL